MIAHNGRSRVTGAHGRAIAGARYEVLVCGLVHFRFSIRLRFKFLVFRSKRWIHLLLSYVFQHRHQRPSKIIFHSATKSMETVGKTESPINLCCYFCSSNYKLIIIYQLMRSGDKKMKFKIVEVYIWIPMTAQHTPHARTTFMALCAKSICNVFFFGCSILKAPPPPPPRNVQMRYCN